MAEAANQDVSQTQIEPVSGLMSDEQKHIFPPDSLIRCVPIPLESLKDLPFPSNSGGIFLENVEVPNKAALTKFKALVNSVEALPKELAELPGNNGQVSHTWQSFINSKLQALSAGTSKTAASQLQTILSVSSDQAEELLAKANGDINIAVALAVQEPHKPITRKRPSTSVSQAQPSSLSNLEPAAATPKKRRLSSVTDVESSTEVEGTPNPKTRPKSKNSSKKPSKKRGVKTDAQAAEKDVARAVETIQNFTSQYANRSAEDIPLNTGSKEQPDLQNLSTRVATVAKQGNINKLPVDELLLLLPLMGDQVEKGHLVSLFHSAAEDIEQDVVTLKKGIEAAVVTLNIMSAPGVDRRLLEEDLLRSVIDLTRKHLERTLMPILDPLSSGSSKSKVSATDDAKKDQVKLLSKRIKFLPHDIGTLLDRLTKYLETQTLADVVLNQLEHTAFQTVSSDLPVFLQLHALELLVAIFRSNEGMRRPMILSVTEALFSNVRTRTEHGTSSRKVPREFKFDSYVSTSETKKIQVLAGLALMLIQAVPSRVVRDTVSLGRSGSPSPHSEDDEAAQKFSTDLSTSAKSCTFLCNLFVSELLSRVLTDKHDKNNARTVTEFIQDLCTLLYSPEWPVAETVLYFIVVGLMKAMMAPSITHHSYLLCIEQLGKVSAVLSSHTASVKASSSMFDSLEQEKPPTAQPSSLQTIAEAKTVQGGVPDDPGEDAKCLCNGTSSDQFMLDCDNCHKWFHGNCVDVTRDTVPNHWLCDACRLHAFVHRVRDRHLHQFDLRQEGDNGAAQQASKISIDDVFRQILIHHLSTKYADTEDALSLYARQYDLAMWHLLDLKQVQSSIDPPVMDGDVAEEDDDVSNAAANTLSKDALAFYWGNWEPDTSFRGISFEDENVPKLSQTALLDLHIRLCSSQHLAQSQGKVRAMILSALSKCKPQARTKLIQALASIIEADDSVLSDPHVRKTVSIYLEDNSVAVREAVINLLGKFIAAQPKFVDQYLPVIAARVKDSGLSVRKRAVRILRDVCLSDGSLSQPNYAKVCTVLLSLSNDTEQSIKNLVLSTFQQAWLDDSNNAATSRRRATLDDLHKFPTEQIQHLQQGEVLFMPTFKALCLQIIKVIDLLNGNTKASDTGCFDGIVALFKEAYAGPKAKTVHSLCEDYCACIANFVVDGHTNADVVQCLRALHVFGLVDPQLLVPHITILNQFLKKSPDDPQMHMIELVLPIFVKLIPRLPTRGHDKLERDLFSMIRSWGKMSLLETAAECLCILVDSITENYKTLEELITEFYDFLYDQSTQEASKVSNFDKKRAMRYLITLGLILKYFDVKKATAQEKISVVFKGRSYFGAKSTHPTIDHNYGCLLSLYQHFANSANPSIARASFIGLFSIFSRIPAMFYPCVKWIKEGLKNDSSLSLQIMVGWKTFLVYEERLILARQSAELKGGVAGKSDSCLGRSSSGEETLSGVMQALCPDITRMFNSPKAKHRYHALSIVHLLLEQAFVQPIHCMAPIVSLLADTEKATTALAMKAIALSHKKYRSELKNRLVEGLTEAFFVRRTVDSAFDPLSSDANAFTPYISSLAQVLSIFTDRKICAEISSKLTDELFTKQPDLWQKLLRLAPDGSAVLQYTGFIALLLAHMPYKFDEPLYIIHRIDKKIGVAGASLQSHLHEHLKEYTASEAPTKELEKKLRSNCHEAMRYCVALKLKAYLKVCYDLNQEKCQAWTPLSSAKTSMKVNKRYSGSFDLSAIVFSQAKASHEPAKKGKKLTRSQSEGNEPVSSVYTRQSALLDQLISEDTTDTAFKYQRAKRRRSKVGTGKSTPNKKRKTPSKRRKRKTFKDVEAGSDTEGEEEEESDASSDWAPASTPGKKQRSASSLPGPSASKRKAKAKK